MAETSGFYNSNNGDRKYDQQFMQRFFNSFIGNGVISNPSTSCQMIANGNMTVTFSPGRAWMNGLMYENDEDITFTLDAADGVLKRIDRIVLRDTTASRNIKAYLKKGMLSSTPVAPALQRDSDMYELGIADIYVNNNVVVISQGNITDLRLNSLYCGVVTNLISQVDTTTLFNQYLSKYTEIATLIDTDIADLKSGFQSTWDTWFTGIKSVLDGDTAGNLYNLINVNTADISVHTSNIATNAAGIAEINRNIRNQNRRLQMGGI